MIEKSQVRDGAVGAPADELGLDRERIERRVCEHFGWAQPAIGAALSDVRACFAHPEFLAAVLVEVGSAIPVEEAVLRWAIARGRLWHRAPRHPDEVKSKTS